MVSKYNVHQKFKLKFDKNNIIYQIIVINYHKKYIEYVLENIKTKDTLKIKDTVIDDAFQKI